MALGVALGAVIAVSGGSHSTNISQSALGSTASPSAPASASPSASASASAGTGTGTTAGTNAAAAAVAPANSFASGAIAAAQMGDVATAPVDGTGKAINLRQSAAQAAASMNCTLQVPANPLTATGLATPWQLGDGCSMANAGTEGAFVEATILSPGGQLQVYNPLVVTAGTQPAARPAAPTIPAGSQVEISVGFNGNNLALTGTGATQGKCVDASGQSLIGEVSACNAVGFYTMANSEMAAGTLKVPAAGTASDGKACQTTRDFALIDQDQSDNVVSSYLINGNGQTAQDSAANAKAVAGGTQLTNGSDDALLSQFVDPANGCTPFTATDSTAPNGASASQALNELQGKADQQSPIATIPTNDEMVLVGGQMNVTKDNVYRSLVDQPLLAAGTSPSTVAADYCQNMVNIAPARNQLDMAKDANFTTPVAATGNNLATFLGNRLSMSFTNLDCGNFGLKNPVTVTLDGNGVATAVTYNTAQQKATVPAATTTTNPFAGQTTGTQARNPRLRTRFQAPSGV
ncbi:MAG: hypothetical protein FWE35_04255 [Streptosporangiales bacterium]|nr:hypothetical protein [Streptosporangiales bacterium]